MKKKLWKFLLPLALASAGAIVLPVLAGATPATVTVADTVYGPNGQPLTGSITIYNRFTFTAADGTIVPAGTIASASIVNGTFSVALVPNVGSNPSGTSYKAVYNISGTGSSLTETWVVPATGPVTLAGVRTSPVPSPSIMFAASQLNPPSGCTNIELLEWTTSGWTCAGTAPANAPPVVHKFLSGYNAATGAFSQAQPAFSDLSGSATLSQLPSTLAQFSGTPTTGDCASWSSSGVLGDAGAACGSGSLSFPLLAPDGSQSAPSYSFSGATGVGMWRNGSTLTVQEASGNAFAFQVGASVALGVNSTGAFFNSPTNTVRWISPGSIAGDLESATLSSARTWTLPDAGGTLPVISGSPSTGNCAKWSSGNQLADAGAACGGASESSVSDTNLAITSTGTQTFTIVTPSNDSLYRTAVFVETATQAAGCSASGTGTVYISWTDAVSGVSETSNTTLNILPSNPVGAGASLPLLGFIRAKAGTAVQAVLSVTVAASGCSTFPKLDIFAAALP